MSETLTKPMRRALWSVAQHKYGWGYLSRPVGERASQRALIRRGLLSLDAEQTYPTLSLTDAGYRAVARFWPNSPANLKTYDRPEGGWDIELESS